MRSVPDIADQYTSHDLPPPQGTSFFPLHKARERKMPRTGDEVQGTKGRRKNRG